MIRRLMIGLSFLIAARPAFAQTVTDTRVWLTVGLQGRVGKGSPWRWAFDSIVRTRDGVEAVETSTFRPALIYSASTHSSVGGGYALVSMYPAAGGVVTEHRIYGVYIWTGLAHASTLTFRVRLEDRIIEGNSGMLWRIRPQARFSHAVRAGGRLAFVASDELSMHLNTTSRSPRGIEQNRAFGGISTAWSSRVRTETGYLNQFLPGHGAANKMNHVLSVLVTISL